MTIDYTANGEASDWMLGELGIYALTIELGGARDELNAFVIEKVEDLKELLLSTEPWV